MSHANPDGSYHIRLSSQPPDARNGLPNRSRR